MSRPSIILLVLCTVLTACAGATDDGPTDIARPLTPGPASSEQVVQHLLEPPRFEGELSGVEVIEAELRTADLYDRHLIYVARPEGREISTPAIPAAGAAVVVPSGSSLSLESAASVARLEGERVTAVESCEAPCQVSGPALVASEGWLQGLAVDDGWRLLVPAPEED